MEKEGRPLWRMVRSMLNPNRLRMLRLLYTTDHPLCVREIAHALGIGDAVASIYLRQLYDFDLIRVERHEIKVFYFSPPGNVAESPSHSQWVEIRDRSHHVSACSSAEMVGRCLRTLLTGDLREGWEIGLMTVLRAFSHFNRLAMLARLTWGEVSFAELKPAVGTCVKTLEHHLAFLNSADLIEQVPHQGPEVLLRLRPPVHPLARTLLALLMAEIETGKDYCNRVPEHDVDGASRRVLRKISLQEGYLDGGWMQKRMMTPVRGCMTKDVLDALKTEDD